MDKQLLETTLLDMVRALPVGKTLAPSDVAQAVAGKAADQWGPLMQPMRRIAVRLAKEGQLVIYRKGDTVDPDDFKGVYRLGAVRID
ncbi:hypothetical protein J3R73_003860 [Labrys monachus]|uniref:DUF3253 domain-containing protein n=1 Tax=Labrys monachus TaxID=217067 RepID=A0ABU0FJ17_9HYPH|nr:hypothetical protein [Labrys monachus]